MRLKRLDIRRCLAILLVIAAHSHISYFTNQVGWTGVDLFFVLSGFLISGLLYTEYKKRQDISFRRFFVRRGLKIYPSFYVLILTTVVAQHLLWHGAPSPFRSILNELVFIQNYFYGLWDHTWSLAVEEHFYIGLALLLLFLGMRSRDRENPFRAIPWIFVGVAALCLTLRGLTIWVFPPADNLEAHVTNPTHARMDALFFGVFLGYLYHFHPAIIQKSFRPTVNRIGILILSGLLLSTCYFFDRDSHFLLFVGLTFLYLGFGGLFLLSMEVRGVIRGPAAKMLEQVGTGCAYVGRHSYSIYLWHAPYLMALPLFLTRVLHVHAPFPVMIALDVIGSCALGIVFARLIEFPVLKFRDRFFPMLQPPLSQAAPTTPTAKSAAPAGETA